MAFRLAMRRGGVAALRRVPLAAASVVPRAAAAAAAPQVRAFADDGSHSDFAPQRKKVTENVDDMMKLIEKQVTDNTVMLYMKGSPNQPQCGFSAQVCKILSVQGADFASVNVLDYPLLRECIKEYSSWPTIPQLYVKGEFIGGCDIVTQMHQSGELEELFKEAGALE
eukprot:CAMPEP_0118857388 /NCGR_PEP_ID=MMETSP1163-20130328/4510_1 /TAXON_ID=124430 /ORGANISM="Phaeomonas parva, Strain CCMP2877" /LENGTH=167 /DNA_ID=CAMNT_0006790695 /DNA_START=192 /DNA_END=695 /DNA_ORIENTATION=-